MHVERMRISRGFIAIFALVQLAFAASTLAQPNNATSRRVVYYYQTQFSQGDNGTFNSLLPLVHKKNLNKHGKPFTTAVLIGAFHLGPEADRTEIHLNDFPPSDKRFDVLWKEVPTLQSKGINVNMFLGGYQDQSYVNLVANFSFFYPILKKTIQTYKLNGIDLDVEDGAETNDQITKVIKQLRSDFGQHFIITLAPVATDMLGGGGLSFIDYQQLYKDAGSNINWFNVQFYSGFGTLASPVDYASMVNNSWPANILVASMMANAGDGGGFVDISTVEKTVKSLVKAYPNFGGVNAWEYFNALPGGTAKPDEWSTVFGKLLGL